MKTKPTLCSFNHITAVPAANGKFLLAERMIDGMEKYTEYWDGPCVAVVEPSNSIDLDRARSGANREVKLDELPFKCEVRDFRSTEVKELVAQASIVQSGIGYRNVHLGKWCKELKVPLVWGSEYSLRTRFQIIRSERESWMRRMRGYQWETLNEIAQIRAIRLGTGIQCNGTPTYDAYKNLTDNPLLFFDGRTRDDQLITAHALTKRLQGLQSGRPLRLAWSGRLNKMKGADELLKVASALKELSTPFTLRIFGEGVLSEWMHEEVQRLGLCEQVFIEGYIPFNEALVPLMKREVDFWLCCHVQGDPSGAYLETLGFGLPIVGYHNEAFQGLLDYANHQGFNFGVSTPMRAVAALATCIQQLHLDRTRLVEWSRAAVEFAKEHTFDRTGERRVRHFEYCMANIHG